MVVYRGKRIGTRPLPRKLLFLKGYGRRVMKMVNSYLWLVMFIVACEHRSLHLLLFW